MKTLADFQPLKPAEEKLLECCQSGEMTFIGKKRPTKKTKANEIRAEFIRWLILTNEIKIDQNGIFAKGVWISGELNLENTQFAHVLWFLMCTFEEILFLRRAITKTIYIEETLFQKGIHADGLICQGNFHLRNNSQLVGEVRLLGAKVEGDLDCSNSNFTALEANKKTLNCDGISVLGYVFLCHVEARGEINFLSAKVGRDFDCMGATLANNPYTLVCDKINVEGTVYLNNDFNAEGELRFFGAKIKGDFSCINATFKADNKKNALNCEGISIGRKIVLSENCKILDGIVDLTSASVGALDDNNFWKQETLKKVQLDGFNYGHIYGDTSASFRLQNMLGKMLEFSPHPYRQLAKVFRNMGHDRDADEVMIVLHDKRLELGKESKWYKAFRKLYKWTSTYGYRPMRTLKIMASIWLLFGCIYWYGANVAVFAPSNPLIFQKDYNCMIDKNGTKWLAFPKDYNESNNWYIASPAEYTTFQPFWYSLDIILPVVDLKMENDWGIVIPSPEGNWKDMIPFTTTNHFIRFLTWVETLAGWGLSLMLVAILSGLAKNEKE